MEEGLTIAGPQRHSTFIDTTATTMMATKTAANISDLACQLQQVEEGLQQLDEEGHLHL